MRSKCWQALSCGLPLTIRQALTVNVPEIREEILARIRKAEDEHDVRVLLAVESGSRAWGFASPDSDYDARFIYVNRPDWYLSVGLEEQRDVIEYDIVDEIDLNGWDLRKALRLFWRSNPAFVEWIQSPIVYVEEGRLATQVRALLPRVYSCTSGVHHYRSMARTNHRGYLRADQVPLKKYFYVLRPLLAARWLEKYQTTPPCCAIFNDCWHASAPHLSLGWPRLFPVSMPSSSASRPGWRPVRLHGRRAAKFCRCSTRCFARAWTRLGAGIALEHQGQRTAAPGASDELTRPSRTPIQRGARPSKAGSALIRGTFSARISSR